MNLAANITPYLEETLATRVKTGGLHQTASTKLPLFLTAQYDIMQIHLFGVLLTLVIRKPGAVMPTPAQAIAHLGQIRQAIPDGPAVLVLPTIASIVRKRFIEKGVPFIVPGQQMFLPMLFVDLRERFSRPMPVPGDSVSWVSQVVILYQLLKVSVTDMTLRELAKRLGYTPMTLTNAAMELKAAGVCDVITKGRGHHLHFDDNGQALWKRVEGLLRSPVGNQVWLTSPSSLDGSLMAGMTALAEQTMLNDDDVPTVALRDRDYRGLLKTGKLVVAPNSDEAALGVEIWMYNPRLLTEDQSVDRLSLYLSLRGFPDPRVEQALKEVFRGMPW